MKTLLPLKITEENWTPLEAEFIRLRYHSKNRSPEETRYMNELEVILSEAFAKGMRPATRYYDVEDIPVIKTIDPSGSCVAMTYYYDPPRLFSLVRVDCEGTPIAKEQFDDLVELAKASTELYRLQKKLIQTVAVKSQIAACQKITDVYAKKQVSGYYKQFLIPGTHFRMHEELTQLQKQYPKTKNGRYMLKKLESVLKALKIK